jgi:hypothetical protein
MPPVPTNLSVLECSNNRITSLNLGGAANLDFISLRFKFVKRYKRQRFRQFECTGMFLQQVDRIKRIRPCNAGDNPCRGNEPLTTVSLSNLNSLSNIDLVGNDTVNDLTKPETSAV